MAGLNSVFSIMFVFGNMFAFDKYVLWVQHFRHPHDAALALLPELIREVFLEVFLELFPELILESIPEVFLCTYQVYIFFIHIYIYIYIYV